MHNAKTLGSPVRALAGPVTIILNSLASLALAVSLKKKGIPNNVYVDRWSINARYAPYMLLDHNVCQPLLEALGLDDEEFRRTIEVPKSIVNSESRPWAQLGLIRVHRPSVEQLLMKNVNLVNNRSLRKTDFRPGGNLLTFRDSSKFLSHFTVFGSAFSSRHLENLGSEPRRLPLIALSGKAQCPEADFETTFGSLLPEPTRCLVKTDKEHGRLLQVWVQHHAPGTPVQMEWLLSRSLESTSAETLRKWQESAETATKVSLLASDELKTFSGDVPSAIADMVLSSSTEAGGRRYYSRYAYFLRPRHEIESRGRSGAVTIGGYAHAVPTIGPCFGADEPSTAIEDGLSLADCIDKFGPSRDAITEFYRLNYAKWEREVKNNIASIMSLHKRHSVRPGMPECRRERGLTETRSILDERFQSLGEPYHKKPISPLVHMVSRPKHRRSTREAAGSNQAHIANGAARAAPIPQRSTGEEAVGASPDLATPIGAV